MTLTIRSTPAAQRDVVRIASYLASFSSQAAALFEVELWRSLELVRANPEIAAVVPDTSPSIRCKRVSQRFRRYLVFYRVIDGQYVEVIRVLHAAQDRTRMLHVS